MTDRNDTPEARATRLQVWLGIATVYVERYARLRPGDANARSDLQRMRDLLKATQETPR